MTTREYLDEQLVAQETATNRRRLSNLRTAYKARGLSLSEAQAVRMCIRKALPDLEAASKAGLEQWVADTHCLPSANRDEPLNEQLVVQETGEIRRRLAAISERYNDDGRRGNDRLLEAAIIRLCIGLALPVLLKEAKAV